MSLIDKYLKKFGVSSYDELNQEERDTYKVWNNALRGRKLTDEDVAQFLTNEHEDCVVKLTTKTLNERDDIFLKAKLDLIRQIKTFLDSPRLEREVITRQIESQL